VDGVILEEGVAVVLSLTSSLGTETVVDLLDNIWDVANGFLAKVFEGATTGHTREESLVEISLLLLAEGVLSSYQFADLSGNAGLFVVGQFGDAGHPVKGTSRRRVVGRRVDGVVLKEGVAVILSLTSALGTKTIVDLLDDVGNMAYSLLSEVFEGVTTGCTSKDFVELVVEGALIKSLQEIPLLLLAEGVLSRDQLANLSRNAGLLVVGGFGDAGHFVESTSGRRVMSGR